jgi:hypothetical protein
MDWPMLRHVERQERRMQEMMRRLGVDPVALARLRCGDAYAEARRRCLLCGCGVAGEECLRWLRQGPRSARRPEFCPNLSLFEACSRPFRARSEAAAARGEADVLAAPRPVARAQGHH